MPTYEYACRSCGQHVEVFQRISDEPLTTCGVCGGALRKVFHPAGVLFKGSGFYVTDSRKSSTKPAAKEASSESKADSKGESKTEKAASGSQKEKTA